MISEGESVGVYLTSKEEKESWLSDLEPYVDLAKGCTALYNINKYPNFDLFFFFFFFPTMVLGVDRPVILYAGGTKGKKKGIKSISRALVPRVFSKKVSKCINDSRLH